MNILLIVKLLLAASGFLHNLHLNDSLLMQVTTRMNANGSGTLAMDVGINNYAFDALSMFRDPLQGFRQTGQASGATITPFGAHGYKGWTMTNTFTTPAGLSALESVPLYRGWCVVSATGNGATGYTIHMIYDGVGFSSLSTRLRLSSLMTLRYRTAAPGHLAGSPAGAAGQAASWRINLVNDQQTINATYAMPRRASASGLISLAGTTALLLIVVGVLAIVTLLLLLVALRYRRRAYAPTMATVATMASPPPSVAIPLASPSSAAPLPLPGAPSMLATSGVMPMTPLVHTAGAAAVRCSSCQTVQPSRARFCCGCGLPLGAGPPHVTGA